MDKFVGFVHNLNILEVGGSGLVLLLNVGHTKLRHSGTVLVQEGKVGLSCVDTIELLQNLNEDSNVAHHF